ncbi:dihydrofolate reductase [Temperatibacter marinus]|uniref:Dihydrofolate reductase n=1 Tax=Temperatibacter marinus TaxID=1456591 RepID=A0AA52HAK1_9PROT|nr:dihydrofolate reductase [Temperatibacter marinus]WND02825.1 dihydrofolate reductase [Temperatibacter marinus]
MKISVIVAADSNWAIGGNNELLWHISEDLKRFKAITLGKPIVMGRKTFESIGRPLPGRENVVITRNNQWQHKGVTVVSSLEAAYAHLFKQDEIMIIGGGEIYKQALTKAHRLYLTKVDLSVDNADTWFPEVDAGDWSEVTRIDVAASAGTPAYSFIDYVRT